MGKSLITAKDRWRSRRCLTGHCRAGARLLCLTAPPRPGRAVIHSDGRAKLRGAGCLISAVGHCLWPQYMAAITALDQCTLPHDRAAPDFGLLATAPGAWSPGIGLRVGEPRGEIWRRNKRSSRKPVREWHHPHRCVISCPPVSGLWSSTVCLERSGISRYTVFSSSRLTPSLNVERAVNAIHRSPEIRGNSTQNRSGARSRARANKVAVPSVPCPGRGEKAKRQKRQKNKGVLF